MHDIRTTQKAPIRSWKRALRANSSSATAGESPQKCKPLCSADTRSTTLPSVAAPPPANTAAAIFTS